MRPGYRVKLWKREQGQDMKHDVELYVVVAGTTP